MSDAPGFMVSLLNGRKFFIENEYWPDGEIAIEGDKVFELHIAVTEPNQITCKSERIEKGPFKTTWIKVPISAIASIEKIGASSFVWQSVLKAKSNLVMPNMQEISQGRQKFGKIK